MTITWHDEADDLIETFGLNAKGTAVRHKHQTDANLRDFIAGSLQSAFVSGLNDTGQREILSVGRSEVTEADRSAAADAWELINPEADSEFSSNGDPVGTLAHQFAAVRHGERLRLERLNPDQPGFLLERVSELLAELAWTGPSYRCICCAAWKSDGHDPTCRLDARHREIRSTIEGAPKSERAS